MYKFTYILFYKSLVNFLFHLKIKQFHQRFHRTTSILQKLCNEISEEIFFSCLWDTVLHSCFTRLSALHFVNGYIAKKSEESKILVIGKDVTLMVNKDSIFGNHNNVFPFFSINIFDFLT